MKITLYELDAHHLATGHTHRWHLCAGSRGYQSRGDDTPARVTWLPLVSQWASVTILAAGDGGSRVARDDMRLINVRQADNLPRWATVYDVTADALLRVALTQRPLNVLLTDYTVVRMVEKIVDAAAAYSSAVTVWQAKAGLTQPDRLELRLPLWDRLADFDQPVLDPETAYAGTGGLEGPASLAGVARERCFGWLPIVAPTYLGVVGGKHTYSVNGGNAIEAVVRGWDKAALYDLVAAPPSSGASPAQFSVDVATGVITIGGAKPEDFRVEVKGTKSDGTWLRYIGQIVGHLATTHGGIVGAVSLTGMDAVARTVGLYLPAGDTTTYRAAFDRLVGSVARGRWYIDLMTDTLIVTRLPRAADVSPARHYRKAAGESDGLRPVGGSGAVPPKQVVVRWGENPSPTDQTASGASADDAAIWSRQWREARSEVNATVAAVWGASTAPLPIDTALTVAADAEAEAPLWLDERSDPPRRYTIRVNDDAPGLWVGDAVRITDDVAGFETGATAVIYGRTNRDRGGGATLYVER
jgi:hypothetical protein